MVTLIIGKKGSGKTKKLINLVNEAVAQSKGNVVCMEKGAKLTYNISHSAKLINSDQYTILGYEAFYGFVSGLCAGNYDITDILIDSTRKIGGYDLAELTRFIQNLDKLSGIAGVKITLSVSLEESDISEELAAITERI
jgi:energy-coupling factor transporter ATP-binding protein EcfA2